MSIKEQYKKILKERYKGEEVEILVEYLWLSTEEDNYNEGADPSTRQDMMAEKSVGRYKSFQDMVKDLNRKYGITDDLKAWGSFSGEPGRINIQMMVDEDNVEATRRELDDFKRGRKRLWIADYQLQISFIKSYQPQPEEISKMFGIQTL